MRGSDYAELRAFAAIVEEGSFARAARRLGMSASALSQTIRKLEDRVGLRLLDRTTRSVAPSAAGERLLADLLPALQQLDLAVAALTDSGDRPSGRLRITTSRLAVTQHLAPTLAAFLDANPLIEMEVVVDDRLTDIVASGCDAGIRLGEALEKDMVAVPIGGPVRQVAVASPDYLARWGTPIHPRDLLQHRCLNFRWPTSGELYRWEFEADGKPLQIGVTGPLLSNDVALLLAAACDGLGIAYPLDLDASGLIEAGRLVPILQDWSPPFPGFYLYFTDRRNVSPPLRAFIDHLRGVA